MSQFIKRGTRLSQFGHDKVKLSTLGRHGDALVSATPSGIW